MLELIILYCIICYLAAVGILIVTTPDLSVKLLLVISPITFPIIMGMFIGALIKTLNEPTNEEFPPDKPRYPPANINDYPQFR